MDILESNNNKEDNPQDPAPAQDRRPNECGTIRVEAYMRIFDPKTNKTFVEGRA